MKSLIGIFVVFAMLGGEALACKDRSAQAAESPESNVLYKQAAALESKGKGNEAVKMYRRAARAGSAAAAKRLGEIYEKGGKGVEPNYQESQKWHLAARSMGEDIPLGKCR
jgi:TPR repeat protein